MRNDDPSFLFSRCRLCPVNMKIKGFYLHTPCCDFWGMVCILSIQNGVEMKIE